MIQNAVYGVPTQGQLNQWANQFGMTHPVLSDAHGQLHDHLDQDGYIPTLALIKYDGTILAKDNEWQVNAHLNEAKPPYGGPAHW